MTWRMWADSVASVRRNLRRAGRLKKSERTSICVPGARPTSWTSRSLPPSMMISVPARASCSRVRRRNLRDGGDAGDGLAAEAVGGDAVEVVAVAELAGGVALEAEERVVLAHAAAVVGDGDEAAPARADLHVDLRRAGIERVFEQLLEDRGGALDDLARRDLVGDVLGQEVDAVHGRRGFTAEREKVEQECAARDIEFTLAALRLKKECAAAILISSRPGLASTAARWCRARSGRMAAISCRSNYAEEHRADILATLPDEPEVDGFWKVTEQMSSWPTGSARDARGCARRIRRSFFPT